MHFLCFVVFGHIFSHDFAPDDERTIEGGEIPKRTVERAISFSVLFFSFLVAFQHSSHRNAGNHLSCGPSGLALFDRLGVSRGLLCA